jgi:hypothetical protein
MKHLKGFETWLLSESGKELPLISIDDLKPNAGEEYPTEDKAAQFLELDEDEEFIALDPDMTTELDKVLMGILLKSLEKMKSDHEEVVELKGGSFDNYEFYSDVEGCGKVVRAFHAMHDGNVYNILLMKLETYLALKEKWRVQLAGARYGI